MTFCYHQALKVKKKPMNMSKYIRIHMFSAIYTSTFSIPGTKVYYTDVFTKVL